MNSSRYLPYNTLSAFFYRKCLKMLFFSPKLLNGFKGRFVHNVGSIWVTYRHPKTLKKTSMFAVQHTKYNFLTKNTIFSPKLKMLNRYNFASSSFEFSAFLLSRNNQKIACSLYFHLLHLSGVILQDYKENKLSGPNRVSTVRHRFPRRSEATARLQFLYYFTILH